MPALAKKLGVPAPSLYRHFANKNQLFTALSGQILERLSFPESDPSDWRDWLKRAIKAYQTMLVENPVILQVEDGRFIENGFSSVYEPVLETLQEAGFNTVTSLQIWSGVAVIAHAWAAAVVNNQRYGTQARSDFMAFVGRSDITLTPRLVDALPDFLSLDIDHTFSRILTWQIEGISAPEAGI